MLEAFPSKEYITDLYFAVLLYAVVSFMAFFINFFVESSSTFQTYPLTNNYDVSTVAVQLARHGGTPLFKNAVPKGCEMISGNFTPLGSTWKNSDKRTRLWFSGRSFRQTPRFYNRARN